MVYRRRPDFGHPGEVFDPAYSEAQIWVKRYSEIRNPEKILSDEENDKPSMVQLGRNACWAIIPRLSQGGQQCKVGGGLLAIRSD